MLTRLPQRLALLVAAVAVLGQAGPVRAATPDAGPPPSSMASLGDSITRGFDSCGFFVDCPARSFATGTDTAVNSHYLRIRAVNPAINGRNVNAGESGANAADLAGQAATAAGQGAQYVTVLIGANDACADTEAQMTPVATFRSQIDAGLNVLTTRLSNAKILVASVPDLKRLWAVGRTSLAARTVWALAGICQSMLANPTSNSATDEDRRNRVRQRVIDYNTQLAESCRARPNCRFDGNAIFGFQFAFGHLSPWDYFHPSTSGQAALAQVSYAAGYAW